MPARYRDCGYGVGAVWLDASAPNDIALVSRGRNTVPDHVADNKDG